MVCNSFDWHKWRLLRIYEQLRFADVVPTFVESSVQRENCWTLEQMTFSQITARLCLPVHNSLLITQRPNEEKVFFARRKINIEKLVIHAQIYGSCFFSSNENFIAIFFVRTSRLIGFFPFGVRWINVSFGWTGVCTTSSRCTLQKSKCVFLFCVGTSRRVLSDKVIAFITSKKRRRKKMFKLRRTLDHEMKRTPMN